MALMRWTITLALALAGAGAQAGEWQSLFDGETLTGWPVATWVMGHLVSRFNGTDWDIKAPKSGQEIQFEHAARAV